MVGAKKDKNDIRKIIYRLLARLKVVVGSHAAKFTACLRLHNRLGGRNTLVSNRPGCAA